VKAGERGGELEVTLTRLAESAEKAEKIKGKGVDDLVLDPDGQGLSHALTQGTLIRRLALKKRRKAKINAAKKKK